MPGWQRRSEPDSNDWPDTYLPNFKLFISLIVELRYNKIMNKREREKLAAYMKALGHPVRLQIVRQLLEHGACFSGDISARLPVAASTTSQHLKILKEAGVITGTVDGPRRCYCVRKEAFAELKDWIKGL